MKKPKLHSYSYLCALAIAATILQADAAHAYVGPGLGLGTIAVVLGVIGSIFLAIFAIVWYPAKRMLKKRRAVESLKEADKDANQEEP